LILKCRNCSACKQGFFKSKPDKWVCTGIPEPFIVDDINVSCTEYPENKKDGCLMKWNVYIYDVNQQKMADFNIFDHGSFVEYVKKAIKKFKNKEVFANQLKSELMYYFWGKSEWEIIISPWCGNKKQCDVKIDVFDQVMLNWDVFVDYVWDNKSTISSIE